LMQFLTEITKIIVTFDLIEKILKKFWKRIKRMSFLGTISFLLS
jgi:hypothetical protein